MTSFDLLSLNEHKEWLNLVKSCDQPDIHFIPKFMELFEEKMTGVAKLFVLESKELDNTILFPFFKSRINDMKIFNSLNDEYFDIVSPWYYGGPLLKSDKNKLKLLKLFISSFQEFIKKNNIVSEYTRIHPMLDVSKDYSKLADAEYKYDVSYIDLTQTIENIWGNIKKSNRNSINSAKRKGIEIKFSKTKNTLEIFKKIYQITMNRLKADKFYYFSDKFFEKFYKFFKNDFFIATAMYERNPVATSLFLFKYGIAYYWLSGYDFKLKYLYPNNLLLYETIKLSKQNNKLFVFGGGEQNLRNFKESFTNTKVPHYTLNNVYNSEIYSKLVTIHEKSNSYVAERKFFPEYRG